MSDFNHLTKKDGAKLRRPIWIAEIRLRATRRIGELSAGVEKSEHGGSGGGTKVPSAGLSKSEVLRAAGLSKSVAHRCEKIAAVPLEQFERHIADATVMQWHYNGIKHPLKSLAFQRWIGSAYFPFSPRSTRRRMASERETLFFAAHASTCRAISGVKRAGIVSV